VSHNPYEATMHTEEVEPSPSTGFVIRFLWACLWRSLVIGIPLMLVVGAGTAAVFLAISPSFANTAARITTALVSIALWVPITKSVIGRPLGGFKLVVIPVEPRPHV
jgi:hypothetical protein